MIVTLMRHYKVSHHWMATYNPKDFACALKEYDNGDVTDQHVQLPMSYEKVLISSLKRTYQTMKYVLGDGAHEATPLLDEVQIAPFTDRPRQFSVNLLNLKARTQWLFNNKRQPETRTMTIKRANDFIDRYLRENLSYLIIAHGFFLRILSREMKKRGFKGNTINFLKNGQYYSYTLP
jgi:broad specificity phosphatase PhoE